MTRCVACVLLAASLLIAGGAHSATASAGTGSTIPFKQDAAGGKEDLTRVAAGLIICVLVLGAVVFVLRRRFMPQTQADGKKHLLRVLETQRLNPRSTLHVVEFAGSYYLVSQDQQGVRRLASSPVVRTDHPGQA